MYSVFRGVRQFSEPGNSNCIPAVSIYSHGHDPLQLPRSKNNSKLCCFRLVAINRVLLVGFSSLNGQSTDGRWQAPDRVPFRKVPFPKNPTLCTSIRSLENLPILCYHRSMIIPQRNETSRRVHGLLLALEPTTKTTGRRIIWRRIRSNRMIKDDRRLFEVDPITSK